MALFKSFLMAGFECSTHRRADGRRLDLVHSSRHAEFAQPDFERLREVGISVAREGLRWHLIEQSPGRYDFSSAEVILRAAEKNNIEVIWDLFHYGWPDDINVFAPEFVTRFRSFCAAFAGFVRKNSREKTLWVCPVNEISYVAWAGGEAAYINPFERTRCDELKAQLIRASIAGADAVWEVVPGARLAQIDPVIKIMPNPEMLERTDEVNGYNNAQYAAWDALGGKLFPELGGAPKYLDVIGVNFYPKNQWTDHGEPIRLGDKRYYPFRFILRDVYERFKRPLFVAETGTEDDERPEWFAYIVEEVAAAIEMGIPVGGICLYPIVNHPGWNDDRHCHNGLWDYADDRGEREIYTPLAEEVARAAHRFAGLLKAA